MRKSGHAIRFLMMSFLFLGLCNGLQAQQTGNDAKPYQPEVGQYGKDVVWVPTPQSLVDKMLDMAKVTSDDFVMDLGSGDGRIVITAAKRGARAVGIEYNPDMVELSRGNAAKAGVSDKATFMKADLFETDLSRASVITMFLLPDINMRLRPKLLEMKPGTRIVSDTFSMGDWASDQSATVDVCSGWCTALLWIVPAKVAGKWTMSGGELNLGQEFQVLGGILTLNGKTVTISSAKMRGDQITFTAGDALYTGRVNGNAMQGTSQANGKSVTWSAQRAPN